MKRKTIVGLLCGTIAGGVCIWGAHAALTFNHTITGEVLDLGSALDEGRDTPAVKAFLESGTNPYNENPACLPKGEELFLTACSGCHGHVGEGKLGPGLNDDYWTYPKNQTDKGLFETIFGGAQGQMGPQYSVLTLDEMLLIMAWTRHLFKGDPQEAKWLTEEQRQAFRPYEADKGDAMNTAANGECKPVQN